MHLIPHQSVNFLTYLVSLVSFWKFSLCIYLNFPASFKSMFIPARSRPRARVLLAHCHFALFITVTLPKKKFCAFRFRIRFEILFQKLFYSFYL